VTNVLEKPAQGLGGSRVRAQSSSCVRSTLDTKCGVMRRSIRGERIAHQQWAQIEPPMPMLTTCLNACRDSPLVARRTRRESDSSCATRALGLDRGARRNRERQRRVQHRHGLRAVMASPRNMRRCAPAGRQPAPGDEQRQRFCVMRWRIVEQPVADSTESSPSAGGRTSEIAQVSV